MDAMTPDLRPLTCVSATQTRLPTSITPSVTTHSLAGTYGDAADASILYTPDPKKRGAEAPLVPSPSPSRPRCRALRARRLRALGRAASRRTNRLEDRVRALRPGFPRGAVPNITVAPLPLKATVGRRYRPERTVGSESPPGLLRASGKQCRAIGPCRPHLGDQRR
jgi:hypothetical protein